MLTILEKINKFINTYKSSNIPNDKLIPYLMDYIEFNRVTDLDTDKIKKILASLNGESLIPIYVDVHNDVFDSYKFYDPCTLKFIDFEEYRKNLLPDSELDNSISLLYVLADMRFIIENIFKKYPSLFFLAFESQDKEGSYRFKLEGYHRFFCHSTKNGNGNDLILADDPEISKLGNNITIYRRKKYLEKIKQSNNIFNMVKNVNNFKSDQNVNNFKSDQNINDVKSDQNINDVKSDQNVNDVKSDQDVNNLSDIKQDENDQNVKNDKNIKNDKNDQNDKKSLFNHPDRAEIIAFPKTSISEEQKQINNLTERVKTLETLMLNMIINRR